MDADTRRYYQQLEEKVEIFENRWFSPPQESPYKIEDFQILGNLGAGTYGVVFLVQKTESRNTLYALKVLNKEKIIRLKQITNTKAEKKILACIDFSFCITLLFYFTDNCNLYIATDFAKAGDLDRYLRAHKTLDEPAARFISAQVIIAFEFIHMAKIIHRDLKPENLLLDELGYVKLTDFGFAKKVEDRTWSLCGTPEYLAPEILLNKGYNKSVDWWMLGVIIYEMCNGQTPFKDTNQINIFDKIVNGKIKYSSRMSFDLKELLKGLLQRNVTKRFGCMKNGAEDIKNNRWFSTIKWIDLLNHKQKSPIRPNLVKIDQLDQDDLEIPRKLPSTSNKELDDF